MEVNKDYNLMVGLRIRELRETLQMTRDSFSKICTACNVTADYIVLGRNRGVEEDIYLELIHRLV